MERDNIIYVGGKPFMNYVTGVCIQFNEKHQKEVVVCARGKFTSRAIDISLVAINSFLDDQNIKIKSTQLSSESFNQDDKTIRVSVIKITLSK